MTWHQIKFYVQELHQFLNVGVWNLCGTNIANNTVWVCWYVSTCWCQISQWGCVLLQKSIHWDLISVIGDLKTVVESLCCLKRGADTIEWEEDCFSILSGELLDFTDTWLHVRWLDGEVEFKMMNDWFGFEELHCIFYFIKIFIPSNWLILIFAL